MILSVKLARLECLVMPGVNSGVGECRLSSTEMLTVNGRSQHTTDCE